MTFVMTGVAVLSAALAPALPGGGGGGAEDRTAGTRAAHERPAAPDKPRTAEAPAAKKAPEPPAPEREVCEDGSDPAASLKSSDKAGDAVKRIQDAGQLVVGVDQNSFLWGYRDPASGDIEGFDIDLVKAVAEDLLGEDPKITYKTIPTDQRIPAIQDGDVDMVVRTMTVNCDRIKEVAFSTAYFESGQQLLVPENSEIDGLDESVRGKRICNATGSTAEKLLERKEYQALGARQVKVANQLDCLVRLQLGEADAVLTDNALGAGQAAQDPSVKMVGEPATIEPYGVAMNRDDEDLVRRVNHVLDDYRKGGKDGKDSKWSAAYEEWLADMMADGEDGAPAPPKPAYKDD
ncbi:hypothetical protein DVA86_23455 [Streptomyces armeniacus]|uniref:Solute-binding protein family 3/N-terminal domain-containing protein n=1 Tax=Streptomyces armeniacus TaxID=83291 RepID=A0A345Y120_9ACTN|nr:glutamate ABC transporter substrate-binding protein [Streptomyces armeniacus]AXK37586.1 hypothetical protein DVA86_23455 [Streptomyces armeniacus]